MLALARLELQPLDVIDVGVGRKKAANVAARAAIGVVVDADPERVALGARKLALEAHPLAGERGVDVCVVELVELAPFDLDDLAAEHLGGIPACPVEKSPVDEAIVLAGVDIAHRHGERIELALRERQQRLLAPTHRLYGRMIEAGEWFC